MKVATCIVGHYRTFEKCSDSILENIIIPNDSDVFINSSNISANIIDTSPNRNVIDVDCLKEYRKVFDSRLKYCCIEYNENKEDNLVITSASRKKQWERFSDCLKHVDNSYDFVVKTRTDLMIYEIIGVDNNIEKNKIYINQHHDFSLNIHDQFFIGRTETIKKLIDFPDVYTEKKRSEIQLFSYLTDKNIDIVFTNFQWSMER